MSMRSTPEQEVEQLRMELAEARQTIRTLTDAYREAIGVPPSVHQARRLEDMAQRLEAAEAELRIHRFARERNR